VPRRKKKVLTTYKKDRQLWGGGIDLNEKRKSQDKKKGQLVERRFVA